MAVRGQETTKRVLTFLLSADNVEKIVKKQHEKHAPVELKTKRVYQGGTATKRMTQADFTAMVRDSAVGLK